MAASSILASRRWTEDSTSYATSNAAEPPGEYSYQRKRSEALLLLLEIVGAGCVGVATDLEPVHHLDTLGEGLSFSVKVHVRKRSGDFVLKVFKHSLVVGDNADFDQDQFTALIMEAYVLGHKPLHDHENIVTMTEINMAIRSSNPLQIAPALCLERAPHGTLDSFQQVVSKSQVNWAMRKMLCYDVAAGLKALHECGIVHGDVKAENVLIFDHPVRGYVAKISDFGSAVIMPDGESQPRKIRLPAYTPPWNAPEATSYMTPSELPLTDVYSLGLLMWRILVHRDPFLLFDIPLDPELQLERKGTILALPNISGLIPCFIEEDVGFLDAKEILLLVRIFAHTISVDPKTRSLDRVLELLEEHSRRLQHSATNATPNSESLRLAALPDKLHDVPSHLDWIQRFHHLVQRQILFALEDFCGFRPIPVGPHTLPESFQDTLLYENAIWAVFKCHLLGIGTDPNPETALDILYHSGLPENGRLWRAWVVIGRLYKAFGIKVPEERFVNVAAMSMNGELGSEFVQIVLSGKEPYDHKVANFHGIELSQEQFRQLVTTIANHGSDRNSGAHAELDDIEVGGNNTLLHASAFYGDAMMTSYLINNRLVNIDATNNLGETALLVACKYNSYDVLDLLLANGVNASITDARGQNGLYWLMSLPQQSTENIARRLIEKGARLQWMVMDLHEAENTELFPQSFLLHGRVNGGPLLQAIARRDLHSVKILLQLCIESYDEPIILPGALFAQPLQLAANLHLFEILEHLCSELGKVLARVTTKEIAPNMVGDLFLYITKTSSVLRSAVRMAHHVYRLCYHGEKWKEAARKTMSVLRQFGFVTQSMVVFNTMERTLNTAIGAGNYEIVKELLQHQEFLERIDEADEDHFDTPVNKALNSRRLDILHLLIEKGATVDLRTKRDPKHKLSGVKASYLHVVASLRIENNAFAELILDQGVPPDIKDNQGLDAFGLALSRCCFNLCRLLLSRGYDLRAPGLFGLTVLGQRFEQQLAKQHDDIYEAVKFLLEYNGPGEQSLFIVDPTNNQSVLHIAVAFPLADDARYRDVLRLLLSHFNKPEHLNAPAANASKSTPLQMAIAMRNPIAAAALIEAGADINIQDNSGSNVMGIARDTITNFIGQGGRKSSTRTSKSSQRFKR
ncbi:hypothetical protein BKA63DRAFT_14064 [Paraphoma chrysanthemicola]|nr:hypothetical protein BKA63DRAFT_14064 [Paraphoma chrysanthemicola]